jgi:sugar/nucleoside kinase (ribokinase family)
MPAQRIKSIDEETGDVVLIGGDGQERTFNLSEIPGGNNWNAQKLAKLTERAQALFDVVVALADLPDDEPTKTMTAAELLAKYGNRVFLDGQGNLVSRATLISFTHDGTKLIPRAERVQ